MFLIVPELEKNMDTGWGTYRESIGQDAYRNPGEELGESTVIKEIKKYEVTSTSGDIISIVEDIKDITLIGNEDYFAITTKYILNRATNEVTTEAGVKGQWIPLHLEKRDYKNMLPYIFLLPTTLEFEGVETIQGLEVYKFKYSMPDVPESEGLPDWASENPFALEEGAMWIEPVSGIIVNSKLNWDVYTTDGITKEKQLQIEVGGVKDTDDTITSAVRIAQNKKQQIILYEIIIPVLLAVMAIALLIVSYLGGLKKDK